MHEYLIDLIPFELSMCYFEMVFHHQLTVAQFYVPDWNCAFGVTDKKPAKIAKDKTIRVRLVKYGPIDLSRDCDDFLRNRVRLRTSNRRLLFDHLMGDSDFSLWPHD